MSDAYRPRTTIDDSQFQGIISIYTTRRAVAQEMPLPNIGDALTIAWGDYPGHVIIARGSEPLTNGQKSIWVQHLPAPASLAAQNAYNLARTGDGTMSRFYVMKRSDYGTSGYLASRPLVGTADPANSRYVFATESVSRIGSDPNSYFIALERIYLLSPRVSRFYDDELECEVLRTTTVIPAGSGTASSSGGVTVEIQDRDDLYDLQVTDAIGSITIVAGLPVLTPFDYPRQLASVPSDSNYPFPLLLRSASIEAAWAFADSPGAARAYDEAWYFAYDLVEPAPGPYEARVLRFLTDDPDELTASFGIDTPPATQREVIGIARWWAHASDKGNSAFAEAREEVVPPSIHDEIRIDLNGVEGLSRGLSRTSLPAVPGFAEFASRRSMIIGYEPRRTRFGLFEIRVIELNTTGIYGGTKVPLGTADGAGDTGASLPSVATKPLAPTATISADNSTITGQTYPAAQVTAALASTGEIVGRASADSNGDYAMTLTTEFVDAVALTLTSRHNSATSYPTTVTTLDLVPAAPQAALAADLATLTGQTGPGLTVTVTRPGTAQVEESPIALIGPTITTSGAAVVTFTSALTGVVAVAPTLTAGDDAAASAFQIAGALAVEPAISAHFAITQASPTAVTITALVAAADDPTLNLAYADGTCVGLAGSTNSADMVPGVAATSSTLVANSSGAFSAVLSPALALGESVTVTATDAGGTSPPTTVTASAAPPTIGSAAFDDSTSIVGVATAGSIVRAYLAGVEIGDDTADGSGNFDITVASLIFGETVLVVAEDPGDPAIRSAPTTVTALDLDLQSPNPELTSAGWIGVAPEGAIAIAYRPTAIPGEVAAQRIIGADPSRAILVTADAPGYAGNRIFVQAYRLAGVVTPTVVVADYPANPTYGWPAAKGVAIQLPPGAFVATVANIITLLNASAAAAFITASLAPGSTAANPYHEHPSLSLFGGSGETVVTPFANGNYTFTLPTTNGEQFAVVARYAAGDSRPVFLNAPSTPLPTIRILAIKAGAGFAPGMFDGPNGSYSAINGQIGQLRSGYPAWTAISENAGGLYIYVPFTPGVLVRFDFPGQAFDPVEHSPILANYVTDHRYEIGQAPLPLGMGIDSLPTLMTVTATYPDGRQIAATFSRADIKFKLLLKSLV